MKINQGIALLGNYVALVPYLAAHVPRYHEWMKDPELQEATASEPLTIEEEYEMQRSWRDDEDSSMIGDVNLFFNDHYDRGVAEAEIMIAEKAYHGKGYGREAMVLMLQYGISELAVTKYIVRIGLNNERSVALFKSLGFVEESVSEVFQEVTLALPVTENLLETLRNTHGQYEKRAVAKEE